VNTKNAALDASFWINLHDVGLVDYLADYFELFVPTIVIQEIEYTPSDVDQLTLAGQTFRNAQTLLVRSRIAKQIKRAAMTALGFLARQRSE
jgi:hypothetical protein